MTRSTPGPPFLFSRTPVDFSAALVGSRLSVPPRWVPGLAQAVWTTRIPWEDAGQGAGFTGTTGMRARSPGLE